MVDCGGRAMVWRTAWLLMLSVMAVVPYCMASSLGVRLLMSGGEVVIMLMFERCRNLACDRTAKARISRYIFIFL